MKRLDGTLFGVRHRFQPARSIGVGGPTGGGVNPGGGISPSLVAKTRRAFVSLGFASPVGDVVIGHGQVLVPWTTQDPSNFGGLWVPAAPTKIQVPAGWEGGSLMFWASANVELMTATTEELLMLIIKNSVTVIAISDPHASAGGAAGQTIPAYDPAPAVGDFYELALQCSNVGAANQNLRATHATFFQARQVF